MTRTVNGAHVQKQDERKGASVPVQRPFTAAPYESGVYTYVYSAIRARERALGGLQSRSTDKHVWVVWWSGLRSTQRPDGTNAGVAKHRPYLS